jgi:hypothetical protein
VVVEHARLAQQRLGKGERAPGVAGQQYALGERRRRVQVDLVVCDDRATLEKLELRVALGDGLHAHIEHDRAVLAALSPISGGCPHALI